LAEFEESIPLDDRYDITLNNALSNACAYFVRAIMSALIIHYSPFFQLVIVCVQNNYIGRQVVGFFYTLLKKKRTTAVLISHMEIRLNIFLFNYSIHFQLVKGIFQS
jgi:hypothetical protein